MAYKKVGWKDYPSTDTPINATNLDHMDAGILENAQTIGDKTKISGIGDGTVAGAIAANKSAIDANAEAIAQNTRSLTQQSYITVNPNYGKNISALVVKCNDRYVVNGMIQLTADAAGQDIFSLFDNGEVVRLKNRCDVLFTDIVNNKLYAAYGVPGFTGIASNTNAIPSGLYIIHGIIR
ncbi:MAG: hypothetical protein ACOCN3_13815 [Roseburia inulinivorans]